jgi:hypothetical protein
MPHACTEDHLVEQPLFAELGWQAVWYFLPHL